MGNVEVYSLAIYVDGSITDRAHLASPSVAKALRIEVKYKDVLRRPVSLDWRGELLPRRDAAAMAHVQGTFAPLRYGDVVLVEYVPERGTVVRVNNAVAVFGANHDLMLAFLDHWLGQRPVSEEMKRALLNLPSPDR